MRKREEREERGRKETKPYEQHQKRKKEKEREHQKRGSASDFQLTKGGWRLILGVVVVVVLIVVFLRLVGVVVHPLWCKIEKRKQ